MDYQERQSKLMDKKEDEVALLNSELSNANSNLAAANSSKQMLEERLHEEHRVHIREWEGRLKDSQK
jgi:hypothetical protein